MTVAHGAAGTLGVVFMTRVDRTDPTVPELALAVDVRSVHDTFIPSRPVSLPRRSASAALTSGRRIERQYVGGTSRRERLRREVPMHHREQWRWSVTELDDERRENLAKAEAIEREVVSLRNRATMPGSDVPGLADADLGTSGAAARRALAYVESEDPEAWKLADLLANAGQLELVIDRLGRAGMLEAQQRAEADLVAVRQQIQDTNGDIIQGDGSGDQARQRILAVAALMREAAAGDTATAVEYRNETSSRS